ncbi:testis-expressed protein 2 isoform X2 [Petromyzon marinus]|uniref:testis-expressed protein 2 isoform X2 n=1 Tax=Petromyzon marinus TaxID=7757 RepID=UPI003F6FD3E3
MTSPARAAPVLGGGAGERPVKPVLQVQRSASRQSLAIHFSASAITEEDEDCDAGATTLLLRRDDGAAGAAAAAAANKAEPGIRPSVSSPAVSSLQPPAPTPPALFALDGARPPVSTVRGAPAGEPPVASRASPSHALAVARPLVSLVKSLGAEAEAPASTAAPGACTTPSSSSSLKPKKLINLVKSLSSDVQDGGDRCAPATAPAPAPRAPASGGDSSRINLQLWRQLTQPRLTVSSALGSSLANGAGGDSKTAPSSPLPSPSDGRASFFRVPEVESRIEDTRRRFSEVIHDPMLLLSKIMAGEETGTGGAGAGGGAAAAASSSSRRHNAEPGATELAVMYSSPGADGTAVATGDAARCDVDDAAAASSSSPASAGAATSGGDCARPARGARPGADGEAARRRRARPGEASPGNAPRAPATSNAEDEAPAAPAAPAVAVEAGAARDRFPLGFPEKLSLSELASRHDDDDDDEDFAVDADPSASSDAADPPAGAGDPDARRGKDSPESELADRDLDDEEEEGGAGAGDTGRAPALPRPPAWRLAALALLVYAYQVLPLPQYACGLALGLALGFAIAVALVWLTASPRRCYRHRPLALEGRERAGAKLDVREPEIYRGWMNELSGYDAETYHAALTRSVFVRLEGSTLRLSRPLRNLPRRALYGEARKEAHFIAQSHYDLTDSQVFLVPPGLANKRLWNQKYPICVVLASRARDPDDRPPAVPPDLSSQNAEQQQGGASAGGAAVAAAAAAVEGGEEEEAAEGGGGGGAVGTEVAVETEARPEKVLYLFGRTGRDKEEWFRRFLRASALKRAGGGGKALTGLLAGHSRSDGQFGRLSHSRNNSLGSGSDAKGRPLAAVAVSDDPCPPPREAGGPGRRWALDYVAYLAPFLPENAEGTGPAGTVARSPARSADSSPTHARTGGPGDDEEGGPQLAWLNAVVGRVLWDFLQEKHWADWVSGKIQKKLSKIKLPYFMNELRLTELDMGSSVPRILRTTKLSVDHQGLWVDLDVSYSGSFTMTLETKMNLTRLGKAVEAASDEGLRLKACSLADSDEESSSAGSSEEDDEPAPLAADLPGPLGDKSQTPSAEGFVGGGGGRTSSKILRLVDKITKSRYFQRATENEFIKKKMEEVSNTPLMLTVSLQECQGVLALNIPPPPTDRIWYGFRSPPRLELKARPKLGERTVTFTHVTEWIESKLEQEFQKILVMPNMDDLYIPVMQSAPDTRAIAPQFRASRAPAADPADTT